MLLFLWSKGLSDPVTKKKSQIVSLSVIAALVLGTITDVVLSSLFSELTQLAPIIMLIPVLSIYHILQRDSFSITESIDKKTSYLGLFMSILFKQNRPGYISAVLMNFIGLASAILFLVSFKSSASLPGIISYTGVLLIITLIKAYKEKNADYIKKINTQTVREKFYSNIFNQAPVGIAIMNETEYTKSDDFNDVNINPSYERILGRSKDELQNINWVQITHSDDLAIDLELFEDFKKGKIDYYSREKRYIKPDGSVVWVDMLISRLAGSYEKLGDHVCIITDITERKNIEATLKYNSEHVLLTGLYKFPCLISLGTV